MVTLLSSQLVIKIITTVYQNPPKTIVAKYIAVKCIATLKLDTENAIDVSSNVGDDVGLFVGGLSEIEIAAVLSLESSLMLEAVVVEVLVTPPELATVEVPAMPSEVGFVANVVVAVVTSLLQTPSESSIGKTLRICFISDVSTGDMYGTINPMRHEKKDS